MRYADLSCDECSGEKICLRKLLVARFGDVLFGGGRFIFWTLAPVVLLFIIVTAVFHQPSSAQSTLVLVGVDVLGVLLVLALYNPKRFHSAGRAATALVFLAYLLYLIDEIASGHSWHFGPRSESSPLNALLGLVIIGIPCLRYTFLGRFGSKSQTCREEDLNPWLKVQCDQCSTPFSDHVRAMFASTVASEKNKARLIEFFEKVKAHDWRSVAGFTDFDATENDVLAFAVRCVSGGFVLVVRSPYELWEEDQLYLSEPVTAAEMSELESLIPATAWNVGGDRTKRAASDE